MEWIEPGPLAQDHAYFLRARLDRAAFEAYVARLGLERATEAFDAFTSGPDERQGGTIAGWCQPEGELYGRQDPGGWCWAWYADGHVHVTIGDL